MRKPRNDILKFSRNKLGENDFIFFLGDIDVNNPLIDLINNNLNIKVFFGDYKNFSQHKGNKILCGDIPFLKTLIEELNISPVIITSFEDPYNHFFKRFFQYAIKLNKIKIEELDKDDFNSVMGEYLRNPENNEYIDNPQSKKILNLHYVKLKSEKKKIDSKREWNIIEEEIQNLAYYGLDDKLDFSLDLFSDIFFDILHNFELFNSKPEFETEILMNLLSQKTKNEIKERLNTDFRLFKIVEEGFFNKYRKMAHGYSGKSNGNPGKYNVKLIGLDEIGGFELILLRMFRRVRKLFVPPGSRRAQKLKEIVDPVELKKVKERKKKVSFPYSTWIDEVENRTMVKSETNIFSLGHEFSISFVIDGNNQKTEDIKNLIESIEENNFVDQEILLVLPNNHKTLKNVSSPITYEYGKSTINDLVNRVKGEYIVFLKPGEILSEYFFQALKNFTRANRSKPDIIYFDTDCLNNNGERTDPWFKPTTYSPEMLLSVNYFKHALYRKDFMKSCLIGEKTIKFNDIGEWNLALIAGKKADCIEHIPHILIHSNDKSTKILFDPNAHSDVENILEQHLLREGLKNPKIHFQTEGSIKVDWDFDATKLVSIIIPTKNNLKFIKPCINSIVSITNYLSIEIIIVDNNSTDKKLKLFYKEIEKLENVKIINYNKKFNYSEANNFGVAHSNGEFILFLNDDTEILDKNWLLELVKWASQPEIGVVGSKLLYGDGTIQFYGTVLGLTGHAGHVFSGMDENSESIYGNTNWYRNFMAITGACMMMRKDVFDQCEGFNEDYILAFNDVELCLKVVELGYRNVCTPFSRLRHFEGMSRSKNVPLNDSKIALENFGEYINGGDVYFNPNISLDKNVPSFKNKDEEDRTLVIMRNQFYSMIEKGK